MAEIPSKLKKQKITTARGPQPGSSIERLTVMATRVLSVTVILETGNKRVVILVNKIERLDLNKNFDIGNSLPLTSLL